MQSTQQEGVSIARCQHKEKTDPEFPTRSQGEGSAGFSGSKVEAAWLTVERVVVVVNKVVSVPHHFSITWREHVGTSDLNFKNSDCSYPDNAQMKDRSLLSM
ncbi:hypothetical protein B0H16DRAFT_1470034 [Mycena metata]|uniref:Uncharacterized protein n=1 Tax=Mycena metata TaxID=1033252 RepID=A0AAD7HXE3_9AGAR|nr:hypothetical protein B0H16DRAFT_1470034 [Mycena metata]